MQSDVESKVFLSHYRQVADELLQTQDVNRSRLSDRALPGGGARSSVLSLQTISKADHLVSPEVRTVIIQS